jgi:ribosomal protein S18 acetylase RimI-like enzyme
VTTPTLRRAGTGDSDFLFDMVNRPDSLSTKIRTRGPIPRHEHEAWFRLRLSDPLTYLHIVEVDGKAAGQVRLQIDVSREFLVDIYILPDYRRSGVAKSAISQAVALVRQEHPEARIVAEVRGENESSNRLFHSLHFRPFDRSESVRRYEMTGGHHDP